MTTASKPGARRSAALKFVEEDLKLPAAMERLHEINDGLIDAVQNQLVWKTEYDNYRVALDERVIEITLEVAERERTANPKVAQAAIDRAITEFQASDEYYCKQLGNVQRTRVRLDEANANWEMARHSHRSIITQINAMIAQLNYLTASKQASSAAFAQLAGL